MANQYSKGKKSDHSRFSSSRMVSQKIKNPVSQHDTLGDVEPDFTEYILIKFQFGEYVIPTATLRPETIFGVVNLWINPEITYKKNYNRR